MKKLLLGLGAATAALAPIAAVVACGDKKQKATPVTTKIYALQDGNVVHTIGFTFGLTDNDLNAGKTEFSDDFKSKLEKAGIANTTSSTITTPNVLQQTTWTDVTKIASSAVNIIFKNQAEADKYDALDKDLNEVKVRELLKKHFTKTGLSNMFFHPQQKSLLFVDHTNEAKLDFTGHNDKFSYFSNFYSDATLQFIKFVY